MAAALAAALFAGGSAPAQEDWDFGEDASRKLSIAAVTFENFGVAVRCMDGRLSVLMSGLPAGTGDRTMPVAIGDHFDERSAWVSDRNSQTVFAVWPRAVAARLSAGGRLSVTAPDGQEMRRFAFDLPPSPAAIDRVFQACGHQLHPAAGEAAPEGEAFAGLRWVRPPEVSFPSRARFEGGLAAVQCKVESSGGLRDCRIESEFPEGSGFGRAATLGAHRTARVGPVDAADDRIAGRSVVFVVRYSMTDGFLSPPPSRLPNRDEAYDTPGSRVQPGTGEAPTSRSGGAL